MHLVINIDGACRGNPGPGSTGVYVTDGRGKVLAEHGRALGRVTNNIAEYAALSDALDIAKKLGGTHLEVRSDSQLLVRQFNGEYRVKNLTLLDALRKIMAKKAGFAEVRLVHVPREQNKEADRLANEALDGAPSGS